MAFLRQQPMNMKYFATIILSFLTAVSFAQSVAINTDGSTGDASALLDVKSSSKGALFPRMTKTQKNTIAAPATGLLVFQTGPDSAGFHYFNGSGWLWLEALENKVWKTAGNAATDTAVNFIGTTDNMPLRFKQNNTTIARWNSNNNTYFIGANAGRLNPAGNNIGIGEEVLSKSVLGTKNIALGDSSMAKNIFGSNNIAIGFYAGKEITSNGSVFIGSQAGQNSTSAFNNFIGMWSGSNNLNGSNNNFLGYLSGQNNISGSGNTAIGDGTMSLIRRGSYNSLLGYRSDIGDTFQDSAFNNSTAIGALALADTSNAMVLGSINGINGATENVNVAIGTTKPKAPLHISRGNAGFTGIIPTNRSLMLEDDFNTYIQMLTPDIRESGIIAGNASGIVKSGIVFTADSAVTIRSGGNFNRVTVDKTGKVGIGTTTPRAPLTVFTGSSGNTTDLSLSGTHVLSLENERSAYVTLFTPDYAEASIFSGNSSTIRRSSITFTPDSSVTLETGGPFTRFMFTKNGQLGINRIPAAMLDVNGSFRIGTNGSINSAIIKDTVSIDVPAVAAGADVNVDISLPNVTVNGAVSVSPASDLPNGIIISWARVSSGGVIRVHYRNTTAGAIDPAVINYYVSVVQ